MLLIFNNSVNAQALNSSNLGGLDSGALQKNNRQQLQYLRDQKRFINTTPIAPIPQKATSVDDEQVKPGEFLNNPTFLLKKITFEGNTIYSEAQLLNFSKNLTNQYVTMEDILNLTSAISRSYQGEGYLTSYAYIPPQDVNNGEIKIRIVESKIDNIIVQGNHWAKSNYLKSSVFESIGVEQNKVFNGKKLQTALKELNNQDYIKGQVIVNKTKDDSTELVLNIQDRPPVGFDVVWDNYGRALTGRQRANLILSYDNLTGYGDKIYGGAILAQGTRGALAGYEIPVGKYGTKLGFDYSASAIKLGQRYKADDITGFSSSYSFRVTQPLYKGPNAELIFASSFDTLKSKTTYNSLGSILSDYNLRVLRTGFYGIKDDNYGRWVGNLGSDFGIKALGASENIDGGPQSAFYNLKAGTTRIQRLPKRSLLIGRLNGQYSPNRLFAAEQMQLGGPYTLRGYEPGVLLGDLGVTGSLEGRTPIPGLGKLLPAKVKHWENKVQFTSFYDFGHVRDHNNLYGYPNHFLHSIGTGLYVYLTDYLSATVNIGMPLGKRYYNESPVRLNFSLNSEIDKFFFKPVERI